MRTLLILITVITLYSCGSKKPLVVTERITEKVTETVHDTVFKIERDSSHYKALLECIGNKVVIAKVAQQTPGKALVSPKVEIEDNTLQVDCEARAQELLAKWKSTNTTKVKEIEVPVYIERELTWWQTTQIWWGRLFAAILLIYTAPKLIKYFKK